jgi:hypothetical protein
VGTFKKTETRLGVRHGGLQPKHTSRMLAASLREAAWKQEQSYQSSLESQD